MTNNEYTLSADEQGMLNEMTAAHQAAFNNELNVLLANIIRYRKLGDGWAYDQTRDRTKLTKVVVPLVPTAPTPTATATSNGVAHA